MGKYLDYCTHPQILGFAWRRSEEWIDEHGRGTETRFFLVAKRDRATLWPLIERHVAPGTMIHTDQWAAYRGLDQLGFLHQSVNHEEHFVDPVTGAHTQTIEAVWSRLRWEVVRTARSVQKENLPKYLASRWWRSLHTHPTKLASKDVFECFLQLIANMYIYF